MSGAALRLCGDTVARADFIPAIVDGSRLVAFAGASAIEPSRLIARREDNIWMLDGAAANVLHGDCADHLVVAAGTEVGMGLFLVAADAPGLSRRAFGTFDGLRAAEMTFTAVRPTHVLALGSEGELVQERVLEHAIAFMAAEAVGLMSMLLDASVEHLKTRRQFGQPLSTFQALRHRAAEMLVALEQARSMAILAAMMVDAPDVGERRKTFAAVKSVVGSAGVLVGQAAVQMHGGLGVSEDHCVGWALRRLMMIEMTFGDSDAWVNELSRLGGFVAPA
jgi:alkylation response protein AidB-like acyl-CoA dehydrogenase